MPLIPNNRRKIFRYAVYISALIFTVWFLFFSLPHKPFDDPYCKVLYSREGFLLNASVASDHQWRFPAEQAVSPKFEQCILTFEDRNFYHHAGISVKGVGRALVQNVKRRKVVSGGSTITMQTIRLMRKNPARTWREKALEMILAVRLELRYSKKDILLQYTSHAPFGNNVVGLDAASWRYFGKKTDALTWGQNALLAVLPNAPGLLYPGKNHDRLQQKRNRLLISLYQRKIINHETLELAMAEPIPDKPLPLPDLARHYFSSVKIASGTRSSINFRIQEQCLHIADQYARKYSDNQIQNIAVIVSDIHTGKIIAYVGNTDKKWNPATAFVDCANAARSTGSILKPLLYYECLSSGLITPQSMLLDVPVAYQHFTPQNYSRSFEGLVPARDALTKSLNIPMVGLLNEYGLQKFHSNLRQLGFRHFNRPASHYGLSLILGSGEVTLRELNDVYRTWACNLYTNKISGNDKACIYETLEAMSGLNRPDENGNWKAFINTQKIAWKTGTSFGNRDAWCVGISASYVVSVWVGNADGSGRTGLTGIEYAAPVLFDIFNVLPKTYRWFPRPTAGYENIALCKASGYKAGEHCVDTSIQLLPASSANVAVCPFHHELTVNAEETYQVNASVCDWQKIKRRNYFILPPAVAGYFKSWNPDFKMPPPFHPGIRDVESTLKIMYPNKSRILLFGTANEMEVSFKAGGTTKDGTIYWHVDDLFIGSTNSIHELKYTLPAGKHTLLILDEHGNQQTTTFDILKAGT